MKEDKWKDGISTNKLLHQFPSKNLFETYEVNGRTYTDNLPQNALISIPKKQYIEYEQQKEEIERLKGRLNKAAKLVRKYTYSITTKEERTNRLNLTDEQYDELMCYLERSDKE